MITLTPNSGGRPEHREANTHSTPLPGAKAESRFTAKAQRCHKHLQAKGVSGGSVYAICTKSLGYEKTYRAKSRHR